jgi:hypothetical protein
MEEFRAVLAVDAEKFSTHRDVELPDLHLEIRRVLAAACHASGLGTTWRNVRFMQSTGDGILAVLPHEAAAALVDPFPRRLQEVLAESAPELRACGLRLRLRVALHVGLVDDERADAPAISTAVIDVCRLLDSRPLRDALERSDPEVTFAVLMLSRELFTGYVAGGRTGLRASQFTAVEARVKQYAERAYLYVPSPSALRPYGDAKPAENRATPAAPGAGTSISGITISGDGSQNAFGNTVGGDFRQERR